jgi:hypothetical protein
MILSMATEVVTAPPLPLGLLELELGLVVVMGLDAGKYEEEGDDNDPAWVFSLLGVLGACFGRSAGKEEVRFVKDDFVGEVEGEYEGAKNDDDGMDRKGGGGESDSWVELLRFLPCCCPSCAMLLPLLLVVLTANDGGDNGAGN